MALGIVIHVEDSNRVGIWRSQIDDIRALGKQYGVTLWRIVDCTADGYFDGIGDVTADDERYPSLSAWWTAEGSAAQDVIGLETQAKILLAGQTAVALPDYTHPSAEGGDVFIVVGPSNGIDLSFIDSAKDWVYVPPSNGGLHGAYPLAIALANRYFAGV